MGQILFSKKEVDTEWNFYASFLEEFVERKYVDKEKTELFEEVYKDPNEFCCLFIVDEDFTKFVFIPYPID